MSSRGRRDLYIGDAYDRLETEDHGPPRILVATFTGFVRDRLIEDLDFVRWEQREPGAVTCENVHRIKGLEFDHVILVVLDDSVTDDLPYVGASRAVMSLTIVSTRATAARFGLS